MLMYFWNCLCEVNCLVCVYYSGEIEDLCFFINYLKSKFLKCFLFVVGFLLGGNVLVKYLGE